MIKKMMAQHFLEFTGINEAIHTKNRAKKMRYLGVAIAILYALITMIGLYSYQLSQLLSILAPRNMEKELLILGVIGSILFSFIGSWLKSPSILFLSTDLPFWLSTPISKRRLVAGKMMIAYLFEVIPTLGFMIPPLILVGNVRQVSWSFYGLGLLGILVLSIPAFILGTLSGIVTQALFKGIAIKKTYFRILGLIASFFCILGFIFLIESQNWVEVLQSILEYLSVSRGINFIVTQFNLFLFEGNNIRTFLYLGSQLMMMVLFIEIISHQYYYILNLFKPKKMEMVKVNVLYKSESIFLSLYKRELKRYFSSSIYVLNTLFSEVLLFIFTVILVFRREIALAIIDSIGLEIGVPEMSMAMLGIVISGLMVLSCTTSSSISLEGRQIEMLKSFPIKPMTIFKAKMAVNLTICLGALVICLPIIFRVLPFTTVETLLTIWLTVNYALFSAVIGLIINLKLPVFNWKSEVIVIKQSASSLISILSGMVAVAGPVFIGLRFLELDLYFLLGGVAIIITFVNIGLYLSLKTIGTRWFQRIELTN